MNLVKLDPALIQTNPEPSVYRCKKCRRIVAAKSNLITHTPKIGGEKQPLTSTSTTAEVHATNDDSTGDELIGGISSAKGPLERISQQMNSINISDRSSDCENQQAQARCKEIIFIEPLAWMVDICKQTQGKLNCPKCNSKLGNFTWINSCNCPCGKNVSPAFYLVPSKVELTHSVQNVQITV